MYPRRTEAACAVVFSLSLTVLAGCGPKPYDIEMQKAAAAAHRASTAPATVEKPVVTAALDHPAPIVGKPDLDRAETNAADHPNDVAANRDAAFTYYKLEAFAQAIPAFQKVVSLAPNDPKGYLYLGYSQMALGSLADAITTFEKVPDLKNVSHPDISDAYLEIGNCDWAMEKYDQAAAAFSKSIGADYHQGLASLGLGTYAAEKGRRAQAYDFFIDATKDLPPGPHRAQAYACLGRLAEDGKDAKDAAADYKLALALDPKNAWAKSAMGRLSSARVLPTRVSPIRADRHGLKPTSMGVPPVALRAEIRDNSGNERKTTPGGHVAGGP